MKKTTVDKRLLAAKHCVSKDPWRYALNSVRVTRENVVATDGRVLVVIENTLDHDDGEDGEILLDVDMIKFAEQMMPGRKSQPVKLTESDDEVLMEGKTKSLKQASVKVAVNEEINYPAYEQVVPKNTNVVTSLSVSLLEKIVKTAKGAGVNALTIEQGENKNAALLIHGDEKKFKVVLMPRRS